MNISVTASHGTGATRVPSVNQNGPVESHAAVGQRTALPISREFDQHHQPERVDDREERCLHTLTAPAGAPPQRVLATAIAG
jgi:hypothetical protein